MNFADVSELFKVTYAKAALESAVQETLIWKTLQSRQRSDRARRRAFLKAVCSTTTGRVHRSTPEITHTMRRVTLKELQNSTSDSFAGTVTFKILTNVENPKRLGVINSIT